MSGACSGSRGELNTLSVKSLRRIVWVIALLCLAWATVLGLDLAPLLRGDYGWRWPYAFPPERPERLLWLALALGVYVAGARWLFCKRHATMILWAMGGSLGLTLAVLYVTTSEPRYELYARTVSSLTTGWHYAAADIDDQGGLGAVMSHWPEILRSYVGVARHVTLSPPGIPLLYYATNQILEKLPALADWLALPLRADQCHNFRLMDYGDGELASAWLGILTPLWASLAVVPTYLLGRRFYSERVARLSVLWWPLVPSLLMFTPNPSTVYPFFSLIAVVLLAEGLERRQPAWVAASGFVMSVLTFMSLSLLPLIFLIGALTLLVYWAKRAEWRLAWHWPFVTGLWFGIGLASIWVVYYLLFSVPVWTILKAVMGEHFALDRPYLPWVFLHLNDFFMFTGWPLMLVAAVGIWQGLKSLKENTERSVGKMLALAAASTLIALDLSGIGRGESGRVWLFLSPFFMLTAAETLAFDQTQQSGWVITVTQALMVLVIVAFVHVIDSGLSRPPATPPLTTQSPQAPYVPSGAIFDGALRLNGFAGQVEMLPNENGELQATLVLLLEWQSSGQVDTPYYLSFIPVAPDGRPAPQALLKQPFDDQYPTTCWLPESGVMRDRYEIPLFENNVKGDWWVSLSLIDGRTGQKPEVILPDGSRDEQVGIGPFRSERN